MSTLNNKIMNHTLNKLILLLFTVFMFIPKGYSQYNADPGISILMSPSSVTQGSTGTLSATVGNYGNETIVENSLRVTISVGDNTQIIGIAPGSDTRWNQLDLTTGPANTIKLTNSGGDFNSFDVGSILLTIRGNTTSEYDVILGNIVYITAQNPLLCGSCASPPLNASQGNAISSNDNAQTSLAVTCDQSEDDVTTATVCEFNTYTWLANNITYNIDDAINGFFTVTIEGENCDAGQVLNLTFYEKYAAEVTTANVCSDEEYTWTVNNVTYNIDDATNGSLTVTIEGADCAANQVLNLTFNAEPQPVVTTANICQGGSYEWQANGLTYTTAQTGLTISGENCEVDQVLNLTVTDQPEEPATACYETATFNNYSCEWDVTGDMPEEPSTTCSQTATFDNDTCTWDVIGSQIVEQTGGETDLCIGDDFEFDLFSLLEGDFQTDGSWSVTTGNTTINGSLFNPIELELGEYTFNYSDTNSECPSETKVTINLNDDCIVLGCGDVIISKAVTPNGDESNEYFTLEGIDLCGYTVGLKIFNRWGAIIYESKDYQNDWNGFAHSSSVGGSDKVPTGTYYYIINLKGSGLKPITGPIYVGTN